MTVAQSGLALFALVGIVTTEAEAKAAAKVVDDKRKAT